jgi:Uncharacterized protein conserved in bacteria
MRIFKTRLFAAWAEEIELSESSLRKAVQEIVNGLYEAKLTSFLYKKRMAIRNQGKRSGARTILALKKGEKVFFLYGYAKNKRANITKKELAALNLLANEYFTYTLEQLARAVRAGELVEIDP